MELNHPALVKACEALCSARETGGELKKLEDRSRDFIREIVGDVDLLGREVTMPGFQITFAKGSAVNKEERFRKYLIDANVDPEIIRAAAVYSKGELGEDRMTVKRYSNGN